MRYILIIVIFITGNSLFSQNYSTDDKVAILNSIGYNVSNADFNERLYQKAKIKYFEDEPDVLIFGSSRSFKINGDIINKKNTLNVGMSSAILHDFLGVYYNYMLQDIKPKEIYFALDPFSLNNCHNRWKVIEDDFESMKQLIETKKGIEIFKKKATKKLKITDLYPQKKYELTNNDSLISEIYQTIKVDLNLVNHSTKRPEKYLNELLKSTSLYDSLKRNEDIIVNTTAENLVAESKEYRNTTFNKLELYQKNNILKLNRIIFEQWYGYPESNLDDIIITHSDLNIASTKLIDGTLSYSYAFENRSTKSIESAADAFKKKQYKKIDDLNKKLFEKFLDYLIADGIKVSFVLVPYHPVVYSDFIDRGEQSISIEFEKYTKQLAEAKRIPFYGSYDPSKYLIEGRDFYDGQHIKFSGLEKLNFVKE